MTHTFGDFLRKMGQLSFAEPCTVFCCVLNADLGSAHFTFPIENASSGWEVGSSSVFKKKKSYIGLVVHTTCNFSTLGGWSGRIINLRPVWAT